MRILGIDYGEKRIGIAISDPLGITAQPLEVIDSAKDVGGIRGILKEYEGVGLIVVGLPKTLKGEVGIAAQKVLEFVERVRAEVGIDVTTLDERLTTAAAEKTMISAGLSRAKRKKVIDKSAAAIMLQNYLDTKRK
jgi:putative Holliday junction resolvase